MSLLVVTPTLRQRRHLLRIEEMGHEHEDGRRVRGQALCGVTGARGSRYGTIEGWLYFEPSPDGTRWAIDDVAQLPADGCPRCRMLARLELSQPGRKM